MILKFCSIHGTVFILLCLSVYIVHTHNESITTLKKCINVYIFSEFELQDGVGMLVNEVQIEVVNDGELIDQISDKNALHKSIVPLLMLAKYFGLFPVHGIKGQNNSYL